MESSPTFSWTSHHWASDPSSGGTKVLELDEKLSNYEMEMKPLLRMDAQMQEESPRKGITAREVLAGVWGRTTTLKTGALGHGDRGPSPRTRRAPGQPHV